MTRGMRSLFIVLLAAGLPFASARAADDGTVVVASFGGLWQQALEKAFVPFETERHVKISFTAGSSMDSVTRAIAARGHPDVDVVMGEELSFGLGREQQLWAKVDPAIVTNLKDIVPQARMGGDDGIGIIMQSVGMFYRTDVFKKNNWAPPTSWSDLLDKRYCHRIGISDPSVSFSYYALMMIGGGKADDFPAGVKRLAGIRDCIDTLDPSAQKTVEKTEIGEYDVGVLAHELVFTMAQRGVPVRFFNPKEGGILQFTTAAIVKDAPHAALAQALLNEFLSPRVQRVLVDQFNVSPVNRTVPARADLVAAGAPDPGDLSHFVTIPTEAILRHRRQYLLDAAHTLAN